MLLPPVGDVAHPVAQAEHVVVDQLRLPVIREVADGGPAGGINTCYEVVCLRRIVSYRLYSDQTNCCPGSGFSPSATEITYVLSPRPR